MGNDVKCYTPDTPGKNGGEKCISHESIMDAHSSLILSKLSASFPTNTALTAENIKAEDIKNGQVRLYPLLSHISTWNLIMDKTGAKTEVGPKGIELSADSKITLVPNPQDPSTKTFHIVEPDGTSGNLVIKKNVEPDGSVPKTFDFKK